MNHQDIDRIVKRYEDEKGFSHELLRLVKELPTLMDLATTKWGDREPNIEFDLFFVAHNEIFTDCACTPIQIRLGPLFSLESNYGVAKHFLTQELMQVIAPPADGISWTNLDKGISTIFSERYSGFIFPKNDSLPSYYYACELFKKFEALAGESAIRDLRNKRKSKGELSRFSNISALEIQAEYPKVTEAIAKDLTNKWDRQNHLAAFPNLNDWYV